MDSMTDRRARVIGGVDAHTDTHDAAALDERGALLATRPSRPTSPAIAQLLAGSRAFGERRAVGVESTGCLRRRPGALPASRAASRVLEVNQPHAHTRRRRGKSDPIDAELAARHVLAGEPPVIPKRHERDRRGDPPAARRPRRRGEGPHRRAERSSTT